MQSVNVTCPTSHTGWRQRGDCDPVPRGSSLALAPQHPVPQPLGLQFMELAESQAFCSMFGFSFCISPPGPRPVSVSSSLPQFQIS